MELSPSLLLLFMLCGQVMPDCGYDTCPKTKPGMLNVHLVPHTHDDVGWLKTVDQYYYGSRRDITPVGVQYILDSVVPELIKDPSKRFIYVEMAFFFRWYNEQDDRMRHQVRALVMNGQLEFILGGWCMNDEAGTHYNAIIDQMAWGMKKLNDTFGECARPRVAWQIDPFGHSREHANLFAQMGFDGLFFGRLDYADKDKRVKEKTMEMIWRGSDSLGDASNLFTGALFNGYGPPNGFCFDVYCDDEPIMDDPRMHDYNADKRADEFVKAAEEWADAYSTKNILMPMGEDFNYVNANSWYKNLDKLIKHVNKRQANGSKINLIYSTPSCYLKSVNDAGQSYSVKIDDFFPYASDPHAYWTGYFTSRPALKGMVRYGNNFLQVCKQLDVLTNRDWTPGIEGDVTVMREAMGVLQHHDAVSGTAKQAVTFDYAQRLANGFKECEKVIEHAMNFLSAKSKSSSKLTSRFCHLSNITQCGPTENEKEVVINVYNPLSRPVKKFVRLPVPTAKYVVTAPNGKAIATQAVPIPKRVRLIPGRVSKATQELVFEADLPALGYKSYYVKKSAKAIKTFKSVVDEPQGKGLISNDHITVTLDMDGMIDSVINNTNGLEFKLARTYGYYEGHAGNNTEFKFRASGAYIFRPIKQTPKLFYNQTRTLVVRGPLVNEIHTEITPYISEVTRLYAGCEDIEVEWLVGPIPVSDGIGKEIVVRYSSAIKSNGHFYTDSNGRQMLERVRNSRPTWKLNVTEPVSGNYYPVNSRIYVEDEQDQTRMTVLTDRSQGGTSMNDGEVELMLHRRLLHDDAFGVGEPLNEAAFGQGLVVRGKHWLQVSVNGTGAGKRHRLAAQEAFMSPIVTFYSTKGKSFSDWKNAYTMEYSALHKSARLPLNVHLLTLEEWSGNSRDSVLIRLEHFFDKYEDDELSKPVTISLESIFAEFKIAKVEEVILSANARTDEVQRLKWKMARVSEEQNDVERNSSSGQSSLQVTLSPMEIKTFIIDLEHRSE